MHCECTYQCDNVTILTIATHYSGDDLGEELNETPSYLADGEALPDVSNEPLKAPAEQESVSLVLI